MTKIPRFAFEKFPGSEAVLTTAMRSVGEAMAIGRTFTESLQKALRSLETDLVGLDPIDLGLADPEEISSALKSRLSIQAPDRILVIAQAFRAGFTVEKVQQYTKFDPWFLRQIETLIKAENWLSENGLPKDAQTWRCLLYTSPSPRD